MFKTQIVRFYSTLLLSIIEKFTYCVCSVFTGAIYVSSTELRVACVRAKHAHRVCVLAKALLQNGGQQVPGANLLPLEHGIPCSSNYALRFAPY